MICYSRGNPGGESWRSIVAEGLFLITFHQGREFAGRISARNTSTGFLVVSVILASSGSQYLQNMTELFTTDGFLIFTGTFNDELRTCSIIIAWRYVKASTFSIVVYWNVFLWYKESGRSCYIANYFHVMILKFCILSIQIEGITQNECSVIRTLCHSKPVWLSFAELKKYFKNVGNSFGVFHCKDKKHLHISQNIFLYISQRKENHTGL